MSRSVLILISLFFAGFLALGFWSKGQVGKIPPIIQTVMENDPAKIQQAIENGADVNVVGPFGITAMLVAIKQGNLETVKLLLDNGVDPQGKIGGMSLVEVAEKEKQEALAEFFRGLE